MEIKNMQYWKRKAILPGLNYEMDNKLPDGRSKSSALQKNETKEGKATVAASKKGSEKLKSQEVTTTQTKSPKAPVPPEKSTVTFKPLTPEERMEKKIKEKKYHQSLIKSGKK